MHLVEAIGKSDYLRDYSRIHLILVGKVDQVGPYHPTNVIAKALWLFDFAFNWSSNDPEIEIRYLFMEFRIERIMRTVCDGLGPGKLLWNVIDVRLSSSVSDETSHLSFSFL